MNKKQNKYIASGYFKLLTYYASSTRWNSTYATNNKTKIYVLNNGDIENNLVVTAPDAEPAAYNINSLKLSRKVSNRYVIRESEDQPVIVNNPSIRKVRKSVLSQAATSAYNTDEESAIAKHSDSEAAEEVSFVSLRKVNKSRSLLYLTSTTGDVITTNYNIDNSAVETYDQETYSDVSWNIQSKSKGLFK
jgi:hypothetical protein